MRFGWFVVAAAAMAQVACTVGAPAMNDAEVSSEIVERVSVARRESLPECTAARESLRAYVRDERLSATCDGETWRDADGEEIAPAVPAVSAVEAD
ncbi:MAG: hypothetical protein KIT84_13590 [Labilithrix sp.]|nr:hypothetical protein [Labilithrix sp.]MCW5812051.1 hypothetical protein [Labilithrix sp.]